MISKSAIVEKGASVGLGSDVWHYSIVRSGARIGKNCNIGSYVFIDKNVVIGDNCKIQNRATLFEGVCIGDGVFIGPHVCFTNDKYPRSLNDDGSKQGVGDWKLQGTYVLDNASIDAGAVIICGTTIGHYAMVGAGSVVTKDVDDNFLVVGIPARFVRRIGKVVKR